MHGVPTHAQLTITLLRLGEAKNAPLPPPPLIRESPPQKPIELSEDVLGSSGGDQPLNATANELQEAIKHHPDTVSAAGGADAELTKSTGHGQERSSKILRFFKGGAKAAVQTAIGIDKIKAKAKSEHAKDRLGAVPPQDEPPIAGPVEFKAHYKGQKGHVSITRNNEVSCVAFSIDSTKHLGSENKGNLKYLWRFPVAEIRELKKHSAYGFKSKLLVGWALDREVRDGLEISDSHGHVWFVTAIPLRDELFNRLCSMSRQIWEII